MTASYGLALGGAFSRGVPDARDLIEQARYAERLGYHSVWAPDHGMMRGPVTECVTLLSAFAGATSRIQLGSGVYLLPLRHPVVTAKMFGMFGYIGPSRETGRRMVMEDLGRWYGRSFDAVADRYCAFGTPAECAETVRSFVDAGADLVVIKLTCAPAEQRDQQAAFAEAVIPLVGDSGRAESPPQPTSFTGDRRLG